MSTLFRAFGMRFAIYSNDHPPPHVHVHCADGEAKIVLLQNGKLQLDWSRRMTIARLRQAMACIEQHRTLIEAAWNARNE